MLWWVAAGWGLLGGLAAGLAALMASVVAAGFAWPWRRDEIGPRAFVFGCSAVLGAVVASATHDSMSGAWPAFVMGVGAPATLRGLLANVAVHTKPEDAAEWDAAIGPAGEVPSARAADPGREGGDRGDPI